MLLLTQTAGAGPRRSPRVGSYADPGGVHSPLDIPHRVGNLGHVSGDDKLSPFFDPTPSIRSCLKLSVKSKRSGLPSVVGQHPKRGHTEEAQTYEKDTTEGTAATTG